MTPDGVEKVKRNDTGADSYDLDHNGKKVADYRADAIEAENMEHNMTVLEAVRAYPMASLWAFVMSCTIVSCLFTLVGIPANIIPRLWSPTVSS